MVELNRCPGVLNVCITRGDDQPLLITFMDPDNTPTLLTGKTYKLTVDTLEDPPDALTKIFEVAGVNQAPDADGVVSFPFAVADVANLLDAFCDTQETDSGGKFLTITKGAFVIEQDISK